MKLKEIGEFGLIDFIRKGVKVPEGVTGIGDDCAIIPQKDGLETLVSTDMLVEGTHFLMEDADPRRLGWKSAAVNVSDIAAMGGKPCGSFLSLALPKELDAGWMEEFIAGFNACCTEYGAPLLGGDTTSSNTGICINVCVLGTCPAGSALRRNCARPGDLVCVTGTLGDSAAGLRAILEGWDEPVLRERHYMPRPRVAEGLALAALPGIHAMMDISDGIASDLRHILDTSGVGAEIELGNLPVSAEMRAFCERHGLDAAELAVAGGEDYELLFTAAHDAQLPDWCTVIGEITVGRELRWAGSEKEFMGFRHF